MSFREPEAAVANTTADAAQEPSVVVVRGAAPPHHPAYAAANDVTIENADAPPTETPIDDVLNRLIIHDNKPIENLPAMVSSELKLIGRCVSLSKKQTIHDVTATYFYTGLVAMVTDSTVTLMHVNRYTAEDFAAYKAREDRIADVIRTAGFDGELRRRGSDMYGERLPPKGAADPRETSGGGMTAARAEAGDPASAHPPQLEPAGSLAPALNLTLDPAAGAGGDGGSGGGGHMTAPKSRPPHFRDCTVSLGVLPYVTFLRTTIHNVAFGRDPTSDFYALFRDPSKQLMDMQYLRTFVRRYLVHTSEGNNPRQVPLYAFLTVRSGCPNLDRGLAAQLVREELPRLMKADRAIAKEKRKQRTREARLMTAAQDYQAPDGLFSNTGILFLTQVPQQTMMSASIMLVFTLGFVLFLIISLTSSQDTLITFFVARMLGCFIPSMLVWGLAAILTLLHSVAMHLPLRDNAVLFIARIIFTVGAVVCAISSIMVITHSLTNYKIWQHMYERRYDSLCAFYDHYQCSGFYYSCGESSLDSLCTSCSINYPNANCYVGIWSRLQIFTMPLLLFSVFILLSSVNSLMVALKLYLVARSVRFAMIS